MLRLEETNHDYFCESGITDNAEIFECWQDFKEDGLDYDFDYNLLFRFDILKDEDMNCYVLELHHALQRRGIEQWHAVIQNIKKEDMPEIENYLRKAKKHLLKMWEEIDVDPNKQKNSSMER